MSGILSVDVTIYTFIQLTTRTTTLCLCRLILLHLRIMTLHHLLFQQELHRKWIFFCFEKSVFDSSRDSLPLRINQQFLMIKLTCLETQGWLNGKYTWCRIFWGILLLSTPFKLQYCHAVPILTAVLCSKSRKLI